MRRARLRVAAAVAWVALCVTAALSNPRRDENRPLLAPMPGGDCAERFDRWLAPIRPMLPERGVIGYVGPERDAGCHPMYVAQFALAPVYVVEVPHVEHRVDLAERRVHLLPRDLPIVLAWGDEGEAWLAASPEYVPVHRVAPHVVLVARAP